MTLEVVRVSPQFPLSSYHSGPQDPDFRAQPKAPNPTPQKNSKPLIWYLEAFTNPLKISKNLTVPARPKKPKP